MADGVQNVARWPKMQRLLFIRKTAVSVKFEMTVVKRFKFVNKILSRAGGRFDRYGIDLAPRVGPKKFALVKRYNGKN